MAETGQPRPDGAASVTQRVPGTPRTLTDDRAYFRSLMQAAVAERLRPIAVGMLALYAALAASHLLFLPPAAAPIMSAVAGATALLCGLLAWWLGRHPQVGTRPPPGRANAFAAGYLGLAGFNSFLHMYLLGDILQTTNIAFLLIATGGLLLSIRWVITITILTLAIWFGMVGLLPVSPYTIHFGFTLFIAMAICLILHTLRVRSLIRLGRLHQQEARYQGQLEELIGVARSSEARFRALADAAFEGIAIHHDGIIIDGNNALAHIFGVPLETLLGRPIASLAPQGLLDEALTVDAHPFELELCRPDGSTFPAEVHGRSFQLDGRELRVALVRDLTDRKREEQDLREAKDLAEAANRAKTAFLANISHELRTPLNAIVGYGELINATLHEYEVPNLSADVQKILNASHQLLALITSVIELSMLESGNVRLQIETVALSDIVLPIADAAQFKLEQRRNAFVLAQPAEWGEIETDENRLRQILFHIVDNALKFTADGTITLGVGSATDHGRPCVVFTVTDTGIGIDPDHLPTIFQPFTQGDSSSTRSYGGTGMGLALSQRLCNVLGGTIVVESRLGQGSTFTITLPKMYRGSQGLGDAE